MAPRRKASDAPQVEAEAPSPRPRLIVTAPAGRRRRHGIDFDHSETGLDPETLGADGFRALVLDPLLVVEIVLRNGARVRIATFPPPEAVEAEIAGAAP